MECVGATAHSKSTDENTCDTGSKAALNVGADQAEQAHGGIPKAQLTQQFHIAKDKTPEESCEMLQGPMTEDLLQAAVTKNFSNQLAVSELESNLQETSGETPRNITVETNHSPRGEWPSWSLPPPEENLRKENAEKNSTLGENSGQQSDEITTVSRQTSPEAPSSSHNSLVTGLNSSRQSNDVAGAHLPVNHEPDLHNSDQGSRNPAEHYHDDTEYVVLLAELQYKLRRHFEENQRLKKLIRQQDQRYDDANVQLGTLKKENKELSEELNTSLRQQEELQLQNQKLEEKMAVMSEECHNAEMEKVKMNVKLAKEKSKAKKLKKQLKRERSKRMRVEMKLSIEKSKEKRMEKRNKKVCKESREKTAQLENSQAQINCLQQDLEVTERLGFQYRRYFEENTELLAESNEMCRKSWQMYLWKDEECKRMDELIGGMEARQIENQEEIEELHRSVTFAGKLYRSEKQQCKDKDAVLQIVNGLMKKLQQESKQQLQDVREGQKIELDRRVAEASQALHNANSDRMKIMKLKLSVESKRVKRMKWMLARERSNTRKLELKLANKKRKGKRMGKRNKKSNIRKCPRDEEEEGAGGGGDDGDDYDDDVVFDDDDDDDDDSSQSGGTFGGHESRDVGELNSTGPGKEGEGESEGGEGGGGDGNGVDDDDEDNSDDDDNSSQSGGTNQGHESPDDGDFSSTGPRKEGGGEGGGNGVNDNHDNHDDCSQSAGTNGGHESQDEGDFSSTGQMTLGCMRRRK